MERSRGSMSAYRQFISSCRPAGGQRGRSTASIEHSKGTGKMYIDLNKLKNGKPKFKILTKTCYRRRVAK